MSAAALDEHCVIGQFDRYHNDPYVSLWRGVVVTALLDSLGIVSDSGQSPTSRRILRDQARAHVMHDGFDADCVVAEIDPSYARRLIVTALEHQAEGKTSRWLSERVKNSIRRV